MTAAVQQGLSPQSGVIPSPAQPNSIGGVTMTDPGEAIGGTRVTDPGMATGGTRVTDPGMAGGSSGPLSRGTPPSAFGSSGTQTPTASAPAAVGAGALPLPGGASSNGVAMSAGYDDGGAIGDGSPQDQGIEDALSVVQDTLNYGRQKNGIPVQQASAEQTPDGQQDQTGSTSSPGDDVMTDAVKGMRNLTGSGLLSQAPVLAGDDAWKQFHQPYQVGPGAQVSMADGGDVPNTPQPQQPGVIPQPGGQGGARPSLVGYAMGSDAASPDVAQALEAKVDPQGTMDGSTRKIKAIAAAPDPQTRWAMMQHYRQKFNFLNAFARAAAQGNQRKPPDMAAAAQAATQAYENVPDGTNIVFQPTKTGVVAHVHSLKGQGGQQGSQQDQSDDDAQGFSKGGVIPGYDPGGEVDIDGTQANSPPDSGADDAQPTVAKPDDTKPQRVIGGMDDQDFSVPLTGPQFQELLTKGNYEETMNNGGDALVAKYRVEMNNEPQDLDVLGQPDVKMSPEKTQQLRDFNNKTADSRAVWLARQQRDREANPDQDLYDETNRLYPNQNDPRRTGFLEKGLEQRHKTAGDVEVQQVKADQAMELLGLKNKGNLDVAKVRGDVSTQNNIRTNQTRQGVANTAAAARLATEAGKNLVGMIKTQIAASPDVLKDPDQAKLLVRNVAAIGARFGIKPQEAIQQAYSEMGEGGQGAVQPSPFVRQTQQGKPLPKSQDQLLPGVVYQTARGPAMWNGHEFNLLTGGGPAQGQ